MPPKLTQGIINAAIEGFECQKQRIDAQIAELRAMLPGAGNDSASESPANRPSRKMSAAGRKAIAEAQRKRWAASRKESETPQSKPKRKLSAAGKAAIVAALKKRWAAKRAEGVGSAEAAGGSSKKAAPKKAATKKKAASKKKVATKKKTAAKKTRPRKAGVRKGRAPARADS